MQYGRYNIYERPAQHAKLFQTIESEDFKNPYENRHNKTGCRVMAAVELRWMLYERVGLSGAENDQLQVLDVKNADYFRNRRTSSQHRGGNLFAQDSEIMGWLFEQ